jgi:hypothetical protein
MRGVRNGYGHDLNRKRSAGFHDETICEVIAWSNRTSFPADFWALCPSSTKAIEDLYVNLTLLSAYRSGPSSHHEKFKFD